MKKVLFFLILLTVRIAAAQESYCIDYGDKGVKDANAYPCMKSGETLYINGDMHFSIIYYELTTYDPERKIKRVELNSPGGNINEIERVVEVVRGRGLATHVRGDSICMSACTMFYQAGVKRTAQKSAQFLYHTVRNNHAAGKVFSESCVKNGEEWCHNERVRIRQELQRSTDIFFAQLEELGLHSSLWRDFLALPQFTSVSDIAEQEAKGNFLLMPNLLLTAEQALKYGAVQEIVE